MTYPKRRLGLVLSSILLVLLGVSCYGLPTMPTATNIPGEDLTSSPEPVQPQLVSSTPTVRSSPADFPPISTLIASPDPSAVQPSPTDLAFNPTITASPSPSATNTPFLSPTLSRRATRTPTITPTPPIPGAGVQFVEPGPMSKIVSPLHLIANIRSVPSGSYRIELWLEPLYEGEEPRLIYREVQRLISNPVDWVYLDQDIQFELSRVSEFAQLRVSVWDTFDRPVSINSVDLLLLSMGTSFVTPSVVRIEPIVIREPAKNKLIQGGTVIVSGLAMPTEDFMLVELVTAEGAVVGYRQVFVTPDPDGAYVPFSVEVPYQVDAPTWVRLRISESGARITGMEHLSSVEVYLSP